MCRSDRSCIRQYCVSFLLGFFLGRRGVTISISLGKVDAVEIVLAAASASGTAALEAATTSSSTTTEATAASSSRFTAFGAAEVVEHLVLQLGLLELENLCKLSLDRGRLFLIVTVGHPNGNLVELRLQVEHYASDGRGFGSNLLADKRK
mgnify:CR=1 FL=1